MRGPATLLAAAAVCLSSFGGEEINPPRRPTTHLFKLHWGTTLQFLMGRLKFLAFYVGLVIAGLHLAESSVFVHFTQTPPASTRFTTAVFRYLVVDAGGRKPWKNLGCSIYCELNGVPLSSCSFSTTILRNLTANYNHHFLISITTSTGERNSSSYNWYIDTTPPTASIFSEHSPPNTASIAVGIAFSEPCIGRGGFKCSNSSTCDVIINGPASVDATKLQIIEPGIKYSLVVVFSPGRPHGRVVIKMANSFCTDQAGNLFMRTKHSILVVHFDRRPMHAELWTLIPSYKLEIQKVSRLAFATNKIEVLKFFLRFRHPIVNSTEEILKVLTSNSGYFVPAPSGIHGNCYFAFQLRNVSNTSIVTVKLRSESLLGRSGTPVSSVRPIQFLYDTTKPRVEISANSPGFTKEPSFNVMVEFSKPVFGFDASEIEVEGGEVTRFKELSKALYSLTILVVSQNVVSLHIPEGKVNDITGNPNSASNQLEVRHYSVPALAVALHSSITAGLLVTSLAAAVVSFSSENLVVTGGVNSAVASMVTSDPSKNLLGMTGHLQVFALSDWFSPGLPIEYSETIKGLRWLIPHVKAPWHKENVPRWFHNLSSYNSQHSLSRKYRVPDPKEKRVHPSTGQDSKFTLSPLEQQNAAIYDVKNSSQNGRVIGGHYGPPLNSEEYLIYFLRSEPSAAIVTKRMENYNGWQDLEMNMFWLGVGGGSLLLLHLLTLIFLRWRMGTSGHGQLSAPAFELCLVILMLPCLGQSAAFTIRGGTTGGIVTGVMLLAIMSALLLSILLFLAIAIFFGGFFEYKEVKQRDINGSWARKLSIMLLGKPTAGKWFQCEGTPSFLKRFGILFENRKGPPTVVATDVNDPNSMPLWTNSGQTGIGRMKAVILEDSNEDIATAPCYQRILGCLKSAYIMLDLLRRAGLGITSGSFSSPRQSQCIIACCATLVQFLYLFLLKPYTRRGVHMVESISLLCETGIFLLMLYVDRSSKMKEHESLGIAMLALLFVCFVSQLVNEWYALINCILRLPQAHKPSFKLGLKWVGKGLVLPFLPRKHWSRLVPGSSQPKNGLIPVVPLSPETELEDRYGVASRAEPSAQTTATVVPLRSPDQPTPAAAGTQPQAVGVDRGKPAQWRQVSKQVSRSRKEEEKHPKVLNLESRNDMRKLRELARASFTSSYQKSGEGSSSHVPGAQRRHLEESSSHGSFAASSSWRKQ